MPELEAVRTQIDNLRAMVTHLGEMRGEVHSSLTRVHDHVCEDVQTIVLDLIAVIDEIEDVLVVRRDEVAGHGVRLGDADVALADHQTRIGTLETDVTALESQVASGDTTLLEGRIDALEADATNLKTDAAKLRAYITENRTTINALITALAVSGNYNSFKASAPTPLPEIL